MAAIIDPHELGEAPDIALGGRSWKIPKLAVRQNKVVVPRIIALNGVNWNAPSEQDCENLYSIVFVALTRAQPTLTRDEFDDLPITQMEALDVYPTIIAAAGMVPRNPPAPAAETTPPAA